MEAEVTDPTKNTENTTKRDKESNEEDLKLRVQNMANSLVAEYNELKNIEIRLRFKQADIHFERQHREIMKKLDEIELVVRNQQIADCLRTQDEERRHIMERIIIVALAFLAAISKLIGIF